MQTPLHHAILCGITPEIIKLLVWLFLFISLFKIKQNCYA